MDELIIELTDINPRHLVICGSKATNLGVLARRSRTASGFCLITTAYFQALSQSEKSEEFRRLTNQLTGKNIDELGDISASIQALIKELPLPEEIERTLYKAYKSLLKGREGVKVAVRSSATAEDLPSASFAGLLESYLNQENWQQVKEAVIACWASLWTPRVIHYRLQKEMNHEEAGMAVIIQEMVPAQASGVMFTANPLTHSRQEIYIEAVSGLADDLVQGQVSGEIYTVDKESLSVTSRSNLGGHPLLTDFSLRQLAHEGKKIEALFGDYQDVEWAFHNEELFVLQTRSITTLAEEELTFMLPEKTTEIQAEIFTNIQERFPEPILPLDAVTAKIYYLSLFAAYGELGFSVPLVDWHRVEQGIFPEHFSPPAIKKSWHRVFHLRKMLKGDLMQEWKDNEASFERYVKLMDQEILKSFPMEIILEYLEDGLKDFQRANTFRYLLYIQYGSVYKLLARLLKLFYGEEGQELLEDIVAGHPQITMEINRALEQLAQSINKDDEIRQLVLTTAADELAEIFADLDSAQEINRSFGLFLQQHGDREVSQGLGGIGALTWRDKPEVVWGMIKGLVLQEGSVEEQHRLQLERQQKAERRLAELTAIGWGRVLPFKKIFDSLVDYSRRYTAFREDSHFYLTQAMSVFRTLFLNIGRQLTKKDYLEKDQDIMYLTFWEVKELVLDIYNLQEVSRRELKENLKERRNYYNERKSKWILRDSQGIKDAGEVLQGVGASRGQVRGTCRVITDPAELYRLKPGDILVAQSTNPSWTPVFSIIGGLVVEYGSALSHAAIIAREYGIPAVMGVSSVTKVLADGVEIAIDGSKGLVILEANH